MSSLSTPKEYTETMLAEGCRRGDRVAQYALYQKYHKKMLGVCIRYVNEKTEAEDVMQEGFIAVFQNIHDFLGSGSLEGWIRRIMVRTAIAHHRKKRAVFYSIDSVVREDAVQEDTLEKLSCEEILLLIQAMPTGYRMVFNLFAIEGYSHQEIGLLLGISEGTSKSQYARAKVFLQQRLTQQNIIQYANTR